MASDPKLLQLLQEMTRARAQFCKVQDEVYAATKAMDAAQLVAVTARTAHFFGGSLEDAKRAEAAWGGKCEVVLRAQMRFFAAEYAEAVCKLNLETHRER